MQINVILIVSLWLLSIGCAPHSERQVQKRVYEPLPQSTVKYKNHVDPTPPVDAAPTRETIITQMGSVFTRSTLYPELGDAWEDPSRLIWGDVVQNGEGLPLLMHQPPAIEHCENIRNVSGQPIGARLPTRAEFERLKALFGYDPTTHRGYVPQILPHLIGFSFWTSTQWEEYRSAAMFVGTIGAIEYEDLVSLLGAFRCVVQN